MAAKDTITLKVALDAKSAAAGLKPLNTALKQTSDAAEDTERELNKLGTDTAIDLKVDDDAITLARDEIRRLRNQVREDLKLDIDADTKVPLRRINELQRVVRKLDEDKIDVDVNVDVDRSSLTALDKSIKGIGGAVGKAPGVLRAVGTVAAGVTLGLSGVAVGVGGIVLETLKLADGMAQAKIAFGQFLGSGKEANKFLADLQTFASKTPFEFPELVESSKTLLAFGIGSKDIVPILTSLGDAAALTGAEVSNLTTIWGQMQAKGKVGNEELLQLTESGIPAYQLLADKMGLSVGEVQDLATKGKLLSDDVLPLLKGKLDETFGGGMRKQAETLGGIWSTMKDTIAGLGTNLGEAFTPVVSEQIGNLTVKLTEWGDWVSENKEKVALAFATMAGGVLDFAADVTTAFQGVILATAGVLETLDSMKALILLINPAAGIAAMFKKTDLKAGAEGLRGIAGGLGDVSEGLHNSADDARKTGKVFAETFRESDGLTRLQHQIRDTKDEIADLRKKPPTAKVELDIQQAELKLQRLRQMRRDFKQEKTQATIEVKVGKSEERLRDIREALRFLATKKATPEVKAEIKEWKRKLKIVRDDLRELREKVVKPRIDPTLYKPKLISTSGELQEVATPKKKPRNAKIKPTIDAGAKGFVLRALGAVANPGGKGRNAKINPKVDGPSLAKSDKDLNHAARDRHSTIYVKTVRVGGGTGPVFAPGIGTDIFVPPDTRPSLVAAGRALAATPTATPTGYAVGAQRATTAASAGTPAAPVRLAPKQTPVAVYLDGAEISTSLELRARQIASVGTVRRRTA